MKAIVTYIDGTEETFEQVHVRYAEDKVHISQDTYTWGYNATTTTIPLTSIRKVVTS